MFLCKFCVHAKSKIDILERKFVGVKKKEKLLSNYMIFKILVAICQKKRSCFNF